MGNKAILRTVGKNIKNARVNPWYPMTQRDLATAAGLSFVHINRIEKGKVNVSLTTLVAIADAIKVPVRDLFDGVGKVPA